jgi:cell division protein FtsW
VTATSVRHPGEFRWETRLLAVVTMMLVLFGIAACYAAGSYLPDWFEEAKDQLSGAAVGALAFLALAYLDYNHLRRVAVPLFWATVAGLVVIALMKIAFPGPEAPTVINDLVPWRNGARRWINLPGMRIQVSEIARLTMPIFVAATAASLGTRVRDFRQGFLTLLWPVALVAGLTMVQPNLSMAIILTLTGVAVAFVAGVRLSHLLLMPALALPAVAVMFVGSRERLERLHAWWQPSINCPATEQHCESLIGFGHGGLFGVGFGKGTQKLGHLAYGHSDYILSIIGEEWGLIGVLFLIACFALFCWMGFRIARTARDPFGAALAAGLTTAIAVGAFIHAAVVTDLMPSTGQTLPFVSTGRVALVIYLAATGIIISIGRRRGRPARAR